MQRILWISLYAFSVHDCLTLDRDLERIRCGKDNKTQITHKDESASSIAVDGKKREIIREKLAISIEPLVPDQHPLGSLINIVTGEVMQDESINVDNALEIGEAQSTKFDQEWPAPFQEPTKKKLSQ